MDLTTTIDNNRHCCSVNPCQGCAVCCFDFSAACVQIPTVFTIVIWNIFVVDDLVAIFYCRLR